MQERKNFTLLLSFFSICHTLQATYFFSPIDNIFNLIVVSDMKHHHRSYATNYKYKYSIYFCFSGVLYACILMLISALKNQICSMQQQRNIYELIHLRDVISSDFTRFNLTEFLLSFGATYCPHLIGRRIRQAKNRLVRSCVYLADCVLDLFFNSEEKPSAGVYCERRYTN